MLRGMRRIFSLFTCNSYNITTSIANASRSITTNHSINCGMKNDSIPSILSKYRCISCEYQSKKYYHTSCSDRYRIRLNGNAGNIYSNSYVLKAFLSTQSGDNETNSYSKSTDAISGDEGGVNNEIGYKKGTIQLRKKPQRVRPFPRQPQDSTTSIYHKHEVSDLVPPSYSQSSSHVDELSNPSSQLIDDNLVACTRSTANNLISNSTSKITSNNSEINDLPLGYSMRQSADSAQQRHAKELEVKRAESNADEEDEVDGDGNYGGDDVTETKGSGLVEGNLDNVKSEVLADILASRTRIEPELRMPKRKSESKQPQRATSHKESDGVDAKEDHNDNNDEEIDPRARRRVRDAFGDVVGDENDDDLSMDDDGPDGPDEGLDSFDVEVRPEKVTGLHNYWRKQKHLEIKRRQFKALRGLDEEGPDEYRRAKKGRDTFAETEKISDIPIAEEQADPLAAIRQLIQARIDDTKDKLARHTARKQKRRSRVLVLPDEPEQVEKEADDAPGTTESAVDGIA